MFEEISFPEHEYDSNWNLAEGNWIGEQLLHILQ